MELRRLPGDLAQAVRRSGHLGGVQHLLLRQQIQCRSYSKVITVICIIIIIIKVFIENLIFYILYILQIYLQIF